MKEALSLALMKLVENSKAALLVCLCLSIVVVACTKVSDDKTDPAIDHFIIDNARLEVGDLLEVQVGVSDNEDLSQIRFRVEESFAKSFGHWRMTQIDDIGGRSYVRNYAFQVPDSALAGYYAVSVQVVDERGNSSIDSLQYISIIRDDQAPSLINFETKPAYDANNRIAITFGDTLSFTGMAYDADSLSSVEIIIQDDFASNIQSQTYNISDTTDVFDFGVSADSIFFNSNEVIPTQMLLKVTDSRGHLLRNVYPIDFDF